jgi:hypothetical protein
MWKKITGAAALVPVLVGQAYAAVPAGVTTAMEDMQEDAITVATAFLIAVIALAAFKMMRKGA